MRNRRGGFGSTPDILFPAFILVLGVVGLLPVYWKDNGTLPWFVWIGAFLTLPCAFFLFIAVSLWLEEWRWKRRKKKKEKPEAD